ncbi:ABC transporter ATP-binding protein [Dactylosporangium vinaceum]|uniref:ABC transporter ATP-binding protein n=1 Tax=Dactylosporangium vinaceum TaxID=53362 RepID=A0ABV5MQB0_9ACTN
MRVGLGAVIPRYEKRAVWGSAYHSGWNEKCPSQSDAQGRPAAGSFRAMTTQTVVLDEVRAAYGDGERRLVALDGVSVAFERGTFTAVMGPSGSGKSTLLHCAAGLERPVEGSVAVDGVVLDDLSEDDLTRLRRDRIGFVFQAFNLVSALTAEQNVSLPMRLAGRRPRAADVVAALAAVGLTDRLRHRPSELSGGEQQRVAIARALISRPAVVFADEPTGALDSVTSRHILDLLRALVDEHRQTVVMVTHDPVAAARADRVVFLADGRIADDIRQAQTAEDIAARTTHLEKSGVGKTVHSGATTRPDEPEASASVSQREATGVRRSAHHDSVPRSDHTHEREEASPGRAANRQDADHLEESW